MEDNFKLLIQERARQIAERAISILQDEDPGDTTAGAAFKFAFLLLRGPKAFLGRFGVGSLSIDADEVRDFCWTLRHELPGGPELSDEEIEILNEHNMESAAYERGARSGGLVLVRNDLAR